MSGLAGRCACGPLCSCIGWPFFVLLALNLIVLGKVVVNSKSGQALKMLTRRWLGRKDAEASVRAGR